MKVALAPDLSPHQRVSLAHAMVCCLLPALSVPVSVLCAAKWVAEVRTPALLAATPDALSALIVALEPFEGAWRPGLAPPDVAAATAASMHPVWECLRMALEHCASHLTGTGAGVAVTSVLRVTDRLETVLRAARHFVVCVPECPVGAVATAAVCSLRRCVRAALGQRAALVDLRAALKVLDWVCD